MLKPMFKPIAGLSVLLLACIASLAAPQARHIITPHARTPRPATLDPASFRDPETRKAYQVARDKPALLEKMACYCGCMGSVENHTSNLDCFVDNHGQGCALCRRIALEASEMHDRGVPVDKIKNEIDNRYAK
jgi:hypothetical protein